MSPIGLLLIGAGIVLVFAAFRDVSPVELVTDTLAGNGATKRLTPPRPTNTPTGPQGPAPPLGPRS